MRAGRSTIEVDEAFLPESGTLPNAEGRIELDRRRREAVLERGYIDDRLERRPGLPLRLDSAVVARSDDIKPALHRHHSAGVDLLHQHATRDLGYRAQRIIIASGLLDDDHHARLEEI